MLCEYIILYNIFLDVHNQHEKFKYQEPINSLCTSLVISADRSISMVNVTCPNDGYDCETGDVVNVFTAALLNAHTTSNHAQNNVGLPAQPRQTPKIDCPVLKDNITEEMWNDFVQSWTIFLQRNDNPEAE